ncbi:MAG: hypothetical protein KDB11_33395, partial [Planctomycetales bacterium]|nr:hypothetical protein [Planctomycetales bacterium]
MPSPPRAPRPTGTVRCPLLMALLVCLATACAVGLADPPESKEAGASKVPAADPKLTADDNLTCVRTAIETEAGWYAIARPCKRLAESGDLRVIPTLIGLMDADNSEDSIYGIGRFGLGPLTGVDYDEVHHGRWWRKWWAVNKHHFRHEVQEMPIPEFPLTEHGKRFAASPPPPDSIVLNPTADDYLARIQTAIHSGDWRSAGVPCQRLAKLGDPRAIPKLIGLMDSDNSKPVIHVLNMEALQPLTGVTYDPDAQHGRWWRKWWAENKMRFPKDVQDTAIPTYPLTKHGTQFAAHPPSPDSIVLEPTADDYLARIKTAIETGDHDAIDMPCRILSELGDERVIPRLIGLMDADNSPIVVKEIGPTLEWLTGVADHSSRNGTWWREWWNVSKSKFPDDVRGIEIPNYPKTEHGKRFAERIEGQPVILDPTLDELLALIGREVKEEGK